MILDEPTVGVDSLLRCRIWNYLEDLCKNHGTTVLITTHYTEEARNAYRVGFIDSGMLLAQDNPERLIFKYNVISLEDVFLELCLQKSGRPIKNHDTIEEDPEEEEYAEADAAEKGELNNNSFTASMKRKNKLSMRKSATLKKSSLKKKNSVGNGSGAQLTVLSTASLALPSKVPADGTLALRNGRPLARRSKSREERNARGLIMQAQSLPDPSKSSASEQLINLNRLMAMLTKNYILFKRNPVAIILLNILPIFQIALYCISFERNPLNIPIAVVNRDNSSSSLSNVSSGIPSCFLVFPYCQPNPFLCRCSSESCKT